MNEIFNHELNSRCAEKNCVAKRPVVRPRKTDEERLEINNTYRRKYNQKKRAKENAKDTRIAALEKENKRLRTLLSQCQNL